MSRETLIAITVVSAPWALVLVVALVRGYSVTLVFRRRGRGHDDE